MKIIDNRIEEYPRFRGLKQRTTFELNSIESTENPEGILLNAFQYCMDKALEQAQLKGDNPDRVGIIVRSEVLDYDMWIPIRPMTDDTVPSLLHQFEKMNTYKNGSLYGAPFEVEISCFDAGRLQKDINNYGQGRIEGHGRKIYKNTQNIQLNHIETGLIKINNEDSYCLFHAVETARINIIEKNRSRFRTYRLNQRKQNENVRSVMTAAGISLDQRIYDIQTNLPLLQNYYDKIYPGQFRILVFQKIGCLKPVFCTGADSNVHPLSIYHEGDTFDAIQKITTFFGIRNY